MSDDSFFELKEAENGLGIPVTVKSVKPFAEYSTSRIPPEHETGFRYEQVVMFIEVKSSLGPLIIRTQFQDITDGNLYSLLSSVTAEGEVVRPQNLLGETVYMQPKGERGKSQIPVILTADRETTVATDTQKFYASTAPLDIKTQDPTGSERGYLEERDMQWLDNRIRFKIERHTSSYGSWVERTVDNVSVNETSITLSVRITPSWTATWEFTGSMKGREAFRVFTNKFDLPTYPENVEGSIVYLNEIGGVPPEVPVYDYPRNKTERLVLSTKPETPDKHKNTSLWEDIKNTVSIFSSQKKVGVSVGERTRRAKSSICSPDIPDPCRRTPKPSPENEDGQVVETQEDEQGVELDATAVYL